MQGQRTTPAAAARPGGAITRRHAALLLQSGVDGGGGGVCVKDLRIRRVVPPTSAPPDSSSPECAAAAKPGPVETTPLEAVPVAAAVEDAEPKPVLPRTKLVRDPGSFGYRRLLPFLNQMAKNDDSNDKDLPSESATANSANELKRSRISLVDDPASGGHRESDPLGSTELVTRKTGGETEKEGCDYDVVGEQTNTVPHDLAGSKPCLTRCTRSRFVHHQSSFSYKRMLPFLMENEISSLQDERVKIRRVTEETQLTPDENDVSASRKHCLAASEDSFSVCRSAQIGNTEQEKPSNADENHVLENRHLLPAVPKAYSPVRNADEAQHVIEEEASTLKQDPLTSCDGESTSEGVNIQASGQHLLPVSQDSPGECSRDVAKTIVQDKTPKSDGSYVLEPTVSEVSPLEDNTSGGQKATEEQPVASNGNEGGNLTLDKGEFIAKDKRQLCDTKESLTAQVEDTAEFPQPRQCQSSYLGCPDVGFSSPTKTVIPSLKRCSLEHQDVVASLDDLHLDAVMICRSPVPCVVDKFLSVEEMSGSIPRTESGSSKAGILRPQEALALGKPGPSPKKLSPRKGILKRHTRGCKGICMCLDCSTYRLRADRAFEFSRKQMQEADDIIGNLLKEMASLRSLVEKPAGQHESIQAACQRAFQVEEVARDRCHQMFVDLNSHCRIPGPRVRFAQYVEEKLGLSPDGSRHMEDNKDSSPCSSSFSKRRSLKYGRWRPDLS